MWNGVLGRWLSLICLTCKHVDMNSNPRTCVEMLGVATCIWNLRAEEMGISKSPGLIGQAAYPLQWEPGYWETVSQKRKGRCHLRNDSHSYSLPSTCSHMNEPPRAHMHLCACTHMYSQNSRETARCFVMFLWYRTVCAAKIKSEKF